MTHLRTTTFLQLFWKRSNKISTKNEKRQKTQNTVTENANNIPYIPWLIWRGLRPFLERPTGTPTTLSLTEYSLFNILRLPVGCMLLEFDLVDKKLLTKELPALLIVPPNFRCTVVVTQWPDISASSESESSLSLSVLICSASELSEQHEQICLPLPFEEVDLERQLRDLFFKANWCLERATKK